MDKGKTKKLHLQTSVIKIPENELPPIIAAKTPFGNLQNHHRRQLYQMVNGFLKPSKKNTAIKNWYLYPTIKIPVKNKHYIISVMVHCLTEVINNTLDDLLITQARTNDLVVKFTGYIADYEQNKADYTNMLSLLTQKQKQTQ
jgi:hypothetical protein